MADEIMTPIKNKSQDEIFPKGGITNKETVLMRSSLVVSSSESDSDELKIEANQANNPAKPAAIDPQQQLTVPIDQKQAKQLPATTFPILDQIAAAQDPAATPAAVNPQPTIPQRKSATRDNTIAIVSKIIILVFYYKY